MQIVRAPFFSSKISASWRINIIQVSKPLYLQKIKAIITFVDLPKCIELLRLIATLHDFIHEQGYQYKRLHYNFVSKESLLEMNKKYLNHDTHTDIITFDYSKEQELEAEFYISYWAIQNSAKETGESVENETLRIISHGPLHCMGWNDKTDKQKIEMRKKENAFIKMFHVKQISNV